jgi:hypothetical protein
MRAPVASAAQAVTIDVPVFRPGGAGPFPIGVLSPGSPRMAPFLQRVGARR